MFIDSQRIASAIVDFAFVDDYTSMENSLKPSSSRDTFSNLISRDNRKFTYCRIYVVHTAHLNKNGNEPAIHDSRVNSKTIRVSVLIWGLK